MTLQALKHELDEASDEGGGKPAHSDDAPIPKRQKADAESERRDRNDIGKEEGPVMHDTPPPYVVRTYESILFRPREQEKISGRQVRQATDAFVQGHREGGAKSSTGA